MKLAARKSFAFSVIILLPFIPALSLSGARNYFILNSYDTAAVKQVETPPGFKVKNRDSLTITRRKAGNDSIQLAYLKIIASKLDTGLSNQITYMQGQNFLGKQVVELTGQVADLKMQLKTKNLVPAQVYQDAEKGKAQKWFFRVLLIVLAVLFGIIAVLILILMQVHKLRLSKQTPLIADDTERFTKR